MTMSFEQKVREQNVHLCVDDVDKILMEYGAQVLLIAVGRSIQGSVQSTGNGHYVGQAIEALAEVEW